MTSFWCGATHFGSASHLEVHIDTQAASLGLRPLGIALQVAMLFFMIGAFSAAYFRRFSMLAAH